MEDPSTVSLKHTYLPGSKHTHCPDGRVKTVENKTHRLETGKNKTHRLETGRANCLLINYHYWQWIRFVYGIV